MLAEIMTQQQVMKNQITENKTNILSHLEQDIPCYNAFSCCRYDKLLSRYMSPQQLNGSWISLSWTTLRLQQHWSNQTTRKQNQLHGNTERDFHVTMITCPNISVCTLSLVTSFKTRNLQHVIKSISPEWKQEIVPCRKTESTWEWPSIYSFFYIWLFGGKTK